MHWTTRLLNAIAVAVPLTFLRTSVQELPRPAATPSLSRTLSRCPITLIPVKYDNRRDHDPSSVTVRGTTVDAVALEPLFPKEETWSFLGYYFLSGAPKYELDDSVQESRGDDLEIIHVAAFPERQVFGLLIAFRAVLAPANTQATVGEIVVLHVEDTRVTELARSKLTGRALPTPRAVIGGWLDPEHWCLRIWELGAEVVRFDVVSWNGASSHQMAEAKRVDFNGGYRIGNTMTPEVAERTKGKLSEWPEPVWFLQARCKPSK